MDCRRALHEKSSRETIQFGGAPERVCEKKLPYILVVGDKEKEAGAVAVRARGNVDLGAMSLEAFSQKIAEDIQHKR